MTGAGAATLNNAALAGLPREVERPAYDRDALTPGIVHLGIGAFHRAHQAVSVDDILAKEPGWGIVGASLRSPTTRDALKPQDGLYALSVRSGEGERLRVIGSVVDILVAETERERLLAAMSDPAHPHRLAHGHREGLLPRSGDGRARRSASRHPPRSRRPQHTARARAGLIVEALARRRAAGIAPFTVLTCDNLPSNGRVVKRILDRFAALRDPDLGAYVAGEIACPSTMVDRITPATTDEDRARISQALGVTDAWPVVTEPFTQWVIEDHFPAGRPDFEAAGAELVQTSLPTRHMKLRLLNGAHSSLAYLGYLAGHEFVSDVMADASFARFVAALMDQATPTLSVPPSTDISAYKAALIQRFENPALKHRTWQIAMDGSQKLPQRLLGTIRDCLKRGLPFGHLALGVAGWMRYVTGIDEKGGAIDVRDPLADRLQAVAADGAPSPAPLARRLIGIEAIFGSDLSADPRFVSTVTVKLEKLYRDGAKRAVAAESRSGLTGQDDRSGQTSRRRGGRGYAVKRRRSRVWLRVLGRRATFAPRNGSLHWPDLGRPARGRPPDPPRRDGDRSGCRGDWNAGEGRARLSFDARLPLLSNEGEEARNVDRLTRRRAFHLECDAAIDSSEDEGVGDVLLREAGRRKPAGDPARMLAQREAGVGPRRFRYEPPDFLLNKKALLDWSTRLRTFDRISCRLATRARHSPPSQHTQAPPSRYGCSC